MKSWMIYSLCFSAIAGALGSRCKPTADIRNAPAAQSATLKALPYTLDAPDRSLPLADELKEISGLSLSPAPSKLAALQDETGQCYLLDKQTGKADPPIFFKADGDFEGIEWKGDTLYAVRSKGTIYEVIHPGTEVQKVIKYETGLTRDSNDVEGLCLSTDRTQLWLACKGPREGVFTRYVFAFDLQNHRLLPDPVLRISLDDVLNYLSQAKAIHRLEKLQSLFSKGAKEFLFGPSGIAIHPLTGEIYLISSLGKTLFVVSREGEIRHIEKLEKEVLPQPEGISFGSDGTLYIASEGREGPAVLCVFKMK